MSSESLLVRSHIPLDSDWDWTPNNRSLDESERLGHRPESTNKSISCNEQTELNSAHPDSRGKRTKGKSRTQRSAKSSTASPFKFSCHHDATMSPPRRASSRRRPRRRYPTKRANERHIIRESRQRQGDNDEKRHIYNSNSTELHLRPRNVGFVLRCSESE